MIQKDVLVADYVHPSFLKGLVSMGYNPTYAPEMSRSEMESCLPAYKGVVVNTKCPVQKTAMEASPSLRWIARLGSGLDIIDLVAAKERGILVISAPEGNAQAVAEHAMGMLLSLSNKLVQANVALREGQWMREPFRGWEVEGKTIGIIGFGNNGSAFGKLWAGWNVKVIAYDKYLSHYGNDKVTETDLETLIHQSDIISLHVPLTAETKEMVNEGFISSCKEGCVIINTSRGKVVDLSALLNGLKTGHILGACVDVYPFEPPSSGPEEYQALFRELCSLPNVVLSPHVAGWTVESKIKIAEVLLEKLKNLYRDID